MLHIIFQFLTLLIFYRSMQMMFLLFFQKSRCQLNSWCQMLITMNKLTLQLIIVSNSLEKFRAFYLKYFRYNRWYIQNILVWMALFALVIVYFLFPQIFLTELFVSYPVCNDIDDYHFFCVTLSVSIIKSEYIHIPFSSIQFLHNVVIYLSSFTSTIILASLDIVPLQSSYHSCKLGAIDL